MTVATIERPTAAEQIERLVGEVLPLVLECGATPMEAALTVDYWSELAGDAQELLMAGGLAQKINDALKMVRAGSAERLTEIERPRGAAGPSEHEAAGPGPIEGTLEIDDGGDKPRSGRFVFRSLRHESAAAYYHLSKPYQAADGTMKALLAFTSEDWQVNRDRARGLSNGYRELARLFARGYRELAKHQTELTRELPASVLAALDGEVGRVLGRRATL